MDKDAKKESAPFHSKRKRIGILVLLLFLIAAGVVYDIWLRPSAPAQEAKKDPGTSKIEYDGNVITEDAKSLQDAVDEINRKAKEGQMSLEMKTQAVSNDGRVFQCFLSNSIKNRYDMYMVLYLDETQKEIYRSGLIPLGGRIEQFELKDVVLESGTYEATLVYNQVEEDKATVHAQVNVGLTLVVN